MAIPLPLLLGGAGILGGLLKGQDYYPAAQAPSRASIYGGALGSGIGGYIGGGILGKQDPLGILGNLVGGRPQDITADDILTSDRLIGDPNSTANGTPGYVPAGDLGRRPVSDNGSDMDRLISALERYSQPRNQGFGSFGPFSILSNLGGGYR